MAKRRVRNYLRRKLNKSMQKKLVILYVLIVLAFVVLLVKVTTIDTLSGDEYTKVILNQQKYNSKIIPFKRGDIVDRNGTKLATSERIYNVVLDAKELTNDTNPEGSVQETLGLLHDCFDIDMAEMEKVIEERGDKRYTVLKKGVTYEQAKKFEKKKQEESIRPKIIGVVLEEDFERLYPYHSLACDTIGFVVDGNLGSCGIEASYNLILNGTDGRQYGYLDEDSTVERTIKPAINGNSVVTTLDLQVQNVVEKHIKKFNKDMKKNAKKGDGSANTAAIVMNPQNGEILAMASYPDFDLNDPRDLSSYFSEKELNEMEDKDKLDALNALWNNYCVSATYEPGSTIKPFTISAGFDLGTLNGSENYDCQGALHISDYYIHCSHRDGHGQQTLKQSLENSCNVALMRIGLDIGKEELCRYQRLFGFGQYTGIDLPGEASTEGLLYDVNNMDMSSLATNAFGQNFNVTMIQLVSGFSSLINGGNYYEPHIVKEIRDENDNVVETMNPVLVRKTISEETCETIKDYMVGVVEEGTATECQIDGYEIGGKTGTAEKLPRGNGKYLVSFIGYAPQENPEVVVYVIIDEPNAEQQANSGYAVSLCQKIMKDIFPYLGVEKTAK